MKTFRKNSISKLLIIAGIASFAGCSSEVGSNEKLVESAVDSSATKQQKISDEAIGEIIKSIPSPIEISMLIKESGSNYNNTILNSNANYSKYNSNFKKALNLGVYGADLGYINIYDEGVDALSYLSSIKSLADGLNIGQFYDFATIKRLASNSKNIDSLLLITTMNFEKINTFLYEEKRSDQCVLILTGGWLEALHISCEVYKSSQKAEILEKIGEQKIVLDQLLLLLSNYNNQPNIKFLYTELEKLKEIYAKVEITYVYHESTAKEVDGVLMIVNETESKVNITPEQVNQISTIIENLRLKVTA